MDIADDTKNLLAGIDVLEVGGKVEGKMHREMKGTHVVEVRYVEVVAHGEVASDEVVAGSVQGVGGSVQATHDAVMVDVVMGDDAMMSDEAIVGAQAKVRVVVMESQGNVEVVQVRDAEVVRVGNEVEVQVNETLSIPLAIIILITTINVEQEVTYQVSRTKYDKIAIRDKSETVVEQRCSGERGTMFRAWVVASRKQMNSGGGTRRISVSYETTGRYR